MSKTPASSHRDTSELARCYADVNQWQLARGMALIDDAAPLPGEQVLDVGCGTGELTIELARRVGPKGQVIGIDTSTARLEQARQSLPPDCQNLRFEEASASVMSCVAASSIDLIYSNYVIQWVPNPEEMLDEVARVLRPGGRLVSEFPYRLPELLVDVYQHSAGGEAALAELLFLEAADWQAMTMERPFETLRLDTTQLAMDYGSLDAYFIWLEGTSHGAFSADKLPDDYCQELQERYPGAVSTPMPAWRMSLRRT